MTLQSSDIKLSVFENFMTVTELYCPQVDIATRKLNSIPDEFSTDAEWANIRLR